VGYPYFECEGDDVINSKLPAIVNAKPITNNIIPIIMGMYFTLRIFFLKFSNTFGSFLETPKYIKGLAPRITTKIKFSIYETGQFIHFLTALGYHFLETLQ